MTEIDPAPILVGDERGVGQVVLVLLISADGKGVEVLGEASSVSALFTDAAVSAFRKASFSPGTKKGAPVATRLRIEVDFGYRRSPSDGAGQSLGDEKR
jgi:protein TonB